MANINSRISLLRLESVKSQTGLARSTIYKLIAEGKFPTQVKIATRVVGWPSNEIDSWITSKMADRKLLH